MVTGVVPTLLRLAFLGAGAHESLNMSTRTDGVGSTLEQPILSFKGGKMSCVRVESILPSNWAHEDYARRNVPVTLYSVCSLAYEY